MKKFIIESIETTNQSAVFYNYSRTRIKETRIKETFGYKKRYHSSDFMQVKLSTLIGQLIKETMDKRNPFLTAQ